MLILRILLNIGMFLSLFMLTWWVPLFLCVVGFVVFERFYEGIILGLVFSGLYGIGGFFERYTVLLFTIVLFLVSLEVKKRIRFFNS